MVPKTLPEEPQLITTLNSESQFRTEEGKSSKKEYAQSTKRIIELGEKQALMTVPNHFNETI